MDIKKIKLEAKKIVKKNLWKILKPYLIIEVIILIITLLLKEYIKDNALQSFFLIFLQIITYPLSIGMIAYILKIIKEKNAIYKEIYLPYQNFFNICALFLIINTLISIGLLLFIIPGLIFMIKYQFSAYVMAEGNPDPIVSMKKSAELIRNYRWNYIKFILSFIGWFVTIIFTFWYTIPYFITANCLYYNELKKKT